VTYCLYWSTCWPVLEYCVRLAARERFVDRDFGNLRDLDLAAEGVLEHVLRDVRVRRRAGPACSLSVTVPQPAPLFAVALLTTANAAIADSAATTASTRRVTPDSFPHVTLLLDLLHDFPARGSSPAVLSASAVALRDPVERNPRARIAIDATTPSPNAFPLQPLDDLVAERS